MAARKSTRTTREKPESGKQERQLRNDAAKALKEARQIMVAEIEKVDSYIRRLEQYTPFSW